MSKKILMCQDDDEDMCPRTFPMQYMRDPMPKYPNFADLDSSSYDILLVSQPTTDFGEQYVQHEHGWREGDLKPTEATMLSSAAADAAWKAKDAERSNNTKKNYKNNDIAPASSTTNDRKACAAASARGCACKSNNVDRSQLEKKSRKIQQLREFVKKEQRQAAKNDANLKPVDANRHYFSYRPSQSKATLMNATTTTATTTKYQQKKSAVTAAKEHITAVAAASVNLLDKSTADVAAKPMATKYTNNLLVEALPASSSSISSSSIYRNSINRSSCSNNLSIDAGCSNSSSSNLLLKNAVYMRKISHKMVNNLPKPNISSSNVSTTSSEHIFSSSSDSSCTSFSAKNAVKMMPLESWRNESQPKPQSPPLAANSSKNPIKKNNKMNSNKINGNRLNNNNKNHKNKSDEHDENDILTKVRPVLEGALKALINEQPEHPVEYLANYFNCVKYLYDAPKQCGAAETAAATEAVKQPKRTLSKVIKCKKSSIKMSLKRDAIKHNNKAQSKCKTVAATNLTGKSKIKLNINVSEPSQISKKHASLHFEPKQFKANKRSKQQQAGARAAP